MTITLQNEEIPVEIIRKKNKNIYFRFREDGSLCITCHPFLNQKEIINLINKNQNALIRMYQKVKEKQGKDQYFRYLGEKYIPIYNEKTKEISFDQEYVLSKNEKMLETFYKKECIRLFKERTESCRLLFSSLPDFTLKIRKMKTRWGVNNHGSKTITLNSDLLKYDVTLIDYVIIHELCHFKEPNHSVRFWNEVAVRYPNYKLARKRLKEE